MRSDRMLHVLQHGPDLLQVLLANGICQKGQGCAALCIANLSRPVCTEAQLLQSPTSCGISQRLGTRPKSAQAMLAPHTHSA